MRACIYSNMIKASYNYIYVLRYIDIVKKILKKTASIF